jgi:CheY-like chemotaxis protein
MNLRMNQPIALSGSTVLLVDDNAIQAATRQTILRRAGYSVQTALNPARALEMLQDGQIAASVGAVITDHIMPGMNGAEFVRELRKTMPSLPVLVISGLEEAQDEYDGLDVRFLLKPLPPEQLIASVRNVLTIEQQGAA